MRVNEEKCIGCLECVADCPVGAIKEMSGEPRVFINEADSAISYPSASPAP
jgi:Fe-S-cluster-containing hydrogenase component 2